MRRLTLLFAAFTVLTLPSAAMAGTVTLTDYSSGHFASNAAGGGGPFWATTVGGPLGNTSFLTFCIEINEHFSYGAAYDYTLNGGAVNGGAGGQTPDNYDPVSDATKWLYYQVVSGSYSSWYGTATGATLNADAGANFQNAFWYLENELAAGDVPHDGLDLANYAISRAGEWNLLFAAGHRVYAMNLTDGAGVHQDQLAYLRVADPMPVPEPATLLMLGSGLLIVSRRLLRARSKA